MLMTYIDNGFYRVSHADALKLANGKLPKHGYEKLVLHNGKHYWLARTPLNGKLVWSIRETNWRLNGNVATL